MRRTLPLVLAVALAACAATPSLAATKKKPKPITRSYTAQATPDPTNNIVSDTCEGKTNEVAEVSRVDQPFTVPAAGSLHVETANQLDWAIVLLDKDGDAMTDSDGETPNTKEALDMPFKKKEKVTIRVCNFAGEPEVKVTYTFTYK